MSIYGSTLNEKSRKRTLQTQMDFYKPNNQSKMYIPHSYFDQFSDAAEH